MKPYQKQDPASIQHLFSSIAPRYDLGNRILSFNLHSWWNRALVQKILPHLSNGGVYLDLCGGTGEIPYTLLQQGGRPDEILVLDFCKEMLEVAKKRLHSKQTNLSFYHEDALKTTLPNQCADVVTVAYGIRNVASVDEFCKEAHRVLKPGGTFAILELTRPNSMIVSQLHKVYLQMVLPCVGSFLTQNSHAYQYLSDTIGSFASPGEISYSLSRSGFKDVVIEEKTFGIATLLTCQKPSESPTILT